MVINPRTASGVHFQTWIFHEVGSFVWLKWTNVQCRRKIHSSCRRWNLTAVIIVFFLPQITLWRSSPLRCCSFRSWRAAGPSPWCLSSMQTYSLWSNWSTVRFFYLFSSCVIKCIEKEAHWQHIFAQVHSIIGPVCRINRGLEAYIEYNADI